VNARQTALWPEERHALALRELPPADQPLVRLQQMGPGALSTAELLEIVTGSSTALGREVLARFDDLHGLARAGLAELAALPGLGHARAARVQAALELGRRLAMAPLDVAPTIRMPQDAAAILMPCMSLLEQETVRVLVLDTRNRVRGNVQVYQGSVNATHARVAELFREAVRSNATAVVLAHNHPSGDPAPSEQDAAFTRSAVKAGEMLGIEVLDHLVIGHNRWVSLKERGLGFN